MKKEIHKLTLSLGKQTIRTEGRIMAYLHVAMQAGNLCVWVEVDTDTDAYLNHFHVVGTGFPVPDGGAHIGSVLDDIYVWHVYQV